MIVRPRLCKVKELMRQLLLYFTLGLKTPAMNNQRSAQESSMTLRFTANVNGGLKYEGRPFVHGGYINFGQ
ncbi:hypothetical protein RRG08_016357 [Elysia crispata]|uniref:Uncharacterized protein n=1 Tax=Elysia crispata TaxID=231223 RepID=A0AAE0Z6E8_9GAST|nr:hypothetical protein RRG08_016357 [Elysia crispata]